MSIATYDYWIIDAVGCAYCKAEKGSPCIKKAAISDMNGSPCKPHANRISNARAIEAYNKAAEELRMEQTTKFNREDHHDAAKN